MACVFVVKLANAAAALVVLVNISNAASDINIAADQAHGVCVVPRIAVVRVEHLHGPHDIAVRLADFVQLAQLVTGVYVAAVQRE